MWPDSPFAEPVGSFIAPVTPPSSDPDRGPQATVRLACEWLPYVRGALYQLLLQTTWKADPDTLNLTQERVFNLIDLFAGNNPGDCGNQPLLESAGLDCGCEDCMGCCLRYQNGVLQCFSCGVWTDVPGQTPGSMGGQPGAGSGVPAGGGGVQKYCFSMPGNSKRVLPTLVNSGDVITISDTQGAWTDFRDLVWNCANGEQFILDGCFPTINFNPADPVPADYHMQIIAYIGATPYAVMNLGPDLVPRSFTVPGGISNAQVVFQANMDDITHGGGAVDFCATVQNNSNVSFTHEFDFSIAQLGWTPWFETGITPPANGAVYIPGVGWGSVIDTVDASLIEVQSQVVPAFTLTSVRAIYEVVTTAAAGGIITYNDNTHVFGSLNPAIGSHDVTVTGSQAGVTKVLFFLSTITPPQTTGWRLTKLFVTGLGSDPF